MRRLFLWSKRGLEAARFPPAVWVLLGAGLVLRLVWVSTHDVTPLSDFQRYDRLALILVLEGTYGPEEFPEAFWPPGWPLVLAATYKVFGTDLQAGTVVAALLSWGATVAGAVIAVRLLRPAFAVAAVAAMSFYPAGIAYTAVVGNEHLAAFLLAVMVAVMLKEQVGGITALLLGVLEGALLITRAELGVVMAGTLLVLFLTRRKDIARPAFVAACSMVGVLLVLSPWIVRNALTFGEFIPTSANGGVAFYRGTLDVEFEARPGLFQSPAEPAGAPPRTEPRERDSFYWEEGFDNVADDPLRWLGLDVQRLERLYHSERNAVEYAEAMLPPSLQFYVANGFWLFLLALAVLGLFALAAQGRSLDQRWLLVIVPVLAASLLKVMFVVQGRHRIAFMMLLILLSAYGAQRGWELLSRMRAAR